MISFNRFGFGIPIEGDILDIQKTKEEVIAWIADNLDPSFEDASPLDLPKDYLNYYWGKWNCINESIEIAKYRREMYTPPDVIRRDIYEYDGEEELLEYKNSYFLTFPINQIIEKTKSILGNLVNKKCLILGCGTGESILHLEAYGIDTYGIENDVYAFKNVNKLAASKVIFGDVLCDTQRYPSDCFDIVYTSRMSWICKKDVPTVLEDITRICKGVFFQNPIMDGNSYKKRSKKWWIEQFKQCNMGTNNSRRYAICRRKYEKCNSTAS
jgi:hypothetical protein